MDCLCPVYVMRTELNPETNEGATEGGDRDTDHLELIRCLVHQFGRAAESLFEYHDFGFPRDVIRRHIDTIEADLGRLRASGGLDDLGIPEQTLAGQVRGIWNSKKNLRYAAGALMISNRFRQETRPENRLRASRLKIVYEAFLDTIDDAIDSGDYNFGDALDLMRHCLGSLTASSFEESRFREELHDRLLPEQRPMTDLLTALATAFRRDFHKSPHGAELRTELERLQTNWILGEAYTMYQKDPTLDVRGFLAAAGHLPAPDDDLEPWERIAGWISHTAADTLLDLCFAETSLSPDALEAHLNAWFYFDSVVTLTNNAMDLSKDLEEGIANIFLIARGSEETRALSRARGHRPNLSMRDYEEYLARTAEMARRNLEHAARSGEDPDSFYPFLAVMAPVVMFTDETGIREDILHAYLRSLAPIMREAIAARPPPIPTIPLGTRSGRSRSARTASS